VRSSPSLRPDHEFFGELISRAALDCLIPVIRSNFSDADSASPSVYGSDAILLCSHYQIDRYVHGDCIESNLKNTKSTSRTPHGRVF
jgi:hypothetical protein